jgi:hypothetical protein
MLGGGSLGAWGVVVVQAGANGRALAQHCPPQKAESILPVTIPRRTSGGCRAHCIPEIESLRK